MKLTTKVGDQTVETVVPYFDVVEKCNDDVEMDGTEKYYDPQTMQWRLVGGPSNGITNVLQGARHDECSMRAPWTINVQGYEHSEDAAEILKKIAKALQRRVGPAARREVEPRREGGRRAGGVHRQPVLEREDRRRDARFPAER